MKKNTDTMNQFIIHGILESGSTFLSQIESDTKNIEEVLDKTGVKAEGRIKEAGRLGKYKNPYADDHTLCRSLLISTDNAYFKGKCFAGGHYLKHFRLTVYIKTFLFRAERELEKKLVTKRYNMIKEGVIQTDFRIKKLQLFTKAKSLISVKKLSD